MAHGSDSERRLRPVILIAASADGIQALKTITEAIPGDFPGSLVIVQHRTARQPSLLVQILGRRAKLPVRAAGEGDAIEPGTIYLARPDLHLTITDDHRFQYVDGQRIQHLLSSANPLFASAAAVLGPQAIGVVLTGSGTDGTDGVQAIKAHGGTVIAQDPRTARHFSMPLSAIKSGAVDLIVPLSDIAPTLMRLVRNGSPVAATGR